MFSKINTIGNTLRTITLNNGKLLPSLGLGCWQASSDEVPLAIEEALKCGYRHIEAPHENEESAGQGIKNWIKNHQGNRKDISVCAKLPPNAMNPDRVEYFLKKSLDALKLSYVDLYLIHYPIGLKGKNDDDVLPIADGKFVIDESTDLIAIWKAMENMVDAGLAKSIGVCNYSILQLRKTCANARILPSVNQVEVHAYYQQRKLQEFCKERDIAITAFAPLGSPGRVSLTMLNLSSDVIPAVLDDPLVSLIAQIHQVTNAQVLIRFLIQLGFSTIPKSANAQRIKMNGDVFSFTLTELEMEALRALDKGDNSRSFVYKNYPGLSDHPECPE